MMRDSFKAWGLVEGFYDSLWSHNTRSTVLKRLSQFNLGLYLYCPKTDQRLSQNVLTELTVADEAYFRQLFNLCAEHGLQLWCGIRLEQPVVLGNLTHAKKLADKCAKLFKIGVRGFVIQFDDLTGQNLAQGQGDMVSAIVEASPTNIQDEAHWVVVPSLYSDDQILHRIYGPFEDDYIAKLNQALPKTVAWVYSGTRVCAPQLNARDVQRWSNCAEREVIIWDNYPVNDAAMINNLHLSPLSGRSADLTQVATTYLANPLLQPLMGILPLATNFMYASNPSRYNLEDAWLAARQHFSPHDKILQNLLASLEVITRRCCLEEFPKTSFEAQNLGELITGLKSRLEAAVLNEVKPWLDRIELAYQILEKERNGNDSKALKDLYNKGKAYLEQSLL